MGRRCFSTAKWSGYALSPSQRMLGLAPRSSSSLTAASLLPKTAWCSVYLLKGVITIGRTRMPQESSAIHVVLSIGEGFSFSLSVSSIRPPDPRVLWNC